MPTLAQYDDMALRYGPRYKWWILIIVGLGTVAGVLSTTSFGVAVPALTRAFEVGQERAQWAVSGFMVAMTLAMLPTPWLLDRVGFRRIFLSAITVLAVASVAGSFAQYFPWLVACRVVQGFAAGLLQPLGTLAVMRLFDPKEQGRASGTLGFGIVLAPAIAPALGGVLLDRFGWPSIFLLNLPFCLSACALALWLLPLPRDKEIKPFDFAGLGLLTASTLALLEGISSMQHSGLFHGWTLAALFISGLSLLGYVRYARAASGPIIPLSVFKDGPFSLGTVVSFTYGFGLYGSTYLIPVYIQTVLGFGAGASGAALLPSGIALALTIPIAGRLADKHSPVGITSLGLALFGASFLVLSLLADAPTRAQIIGVTVMGRVGLGLILPALSLAALRGLRSTQLGEASTVMSYARQTGGSLGIAITAVFVQWREHWHAGLSHPVSDAYGEGFMLIAVVFALALMAASRMHTGQQAVARRGI